MSGNKSAADLELASKTELTELASEVGEKLNAPSDAGTAGQVLTLDEGLNPIWDDVQGVGGTGDYDDLTNKPSINGTTLSGNKTLAQLGAIAEPEQEGTNGQVLTTDGNGGRSWTTVQGGSGGEGITILDYDDIDTNTALQVFANPTKYVIRKAGYLYGLYFKSASDVLYQCSVHDILEGESIGVEDYVITIYSNGSKEYFSSDAYAANSENVIYNPDSSIEWGAVPVSEGDGTTEWYNLKTINGESILGDGDIDIQLFDITVIDIANWTTTIGLTVYNKPLNYYIKKDNEIYQYSRVNSNGKYFTRYEFTRDSNTNIVTLAENGIIVASNGNYTTFTATNPTVYESGKVDSLLTAKQNVINATNKLSANYINGLANVSTSGDYGDLNNKPSIPDPIVIVTTSELESNISMRRALILHPANYVVLYGSRDVACQLVETDQRRFAKYAVTAFQTSTDSIAFVQLLVEITENNVTYTETNKTLVPKSYVDTKITKPSQEGTSGQVLTLDSELNPIWDDVQGGGGTSDYSNLSNKPSINSVTLTGNKTAEDLGLATSADLTSKIGDLQDLETTEKDNLVDAINEANYSSIIEGRIESLVNYLRNTYRGERITDEFVNEKIAEASFEEYNAIYDLNGDGVVNNTDIAVYTTYSYKNINNLRYIKSDIGDLSDLETTDNSNLVDAINELVDGKLDSPLTAGTAGQVLTLDDDLNPVWEDAQGGGTSDYSDLTNKPSINSVTLSGNKTSSDLGLADKTVVATTQPAGGMLPDAVYNLGELSGTITFALAAAVSGNVNHYFWTFSTGATAPTVTWPNGITWQGGSAPTINASKHYEVSILNGYGVAMEA